MQRASIWKPAWYELDQNLTVGETDTFLFVTSCSPIRFATSFEQGEWHKAIIISISNKELGNIIKIDAEGLSYKFYSAAGNFIQIEAEETPGKFETGDREGSYLIYTEFIVEAELLGQDASVSFA
jgi:hypothetical protein